MRCLFIAAPTAKAFLEAKKSFCAIPTLHLPKEGGGIPDDGDDDAPGGGGGGAPGGGGGIPAFAALTGFE